MDTNDTLTTTPADELKVLRQYRTALNDVGLARLAELEARFAPPAPPAVRTFLVTLAEDAELEGADMAIADALARAGVAIDSVRPVGPADVPDFAMFSDAGNLYVAKAVADLIAWRPSEPVDVWGWCDALGARGKPLGFGEAGDTAVREKVYDALTSAGIVTA